jgi:hypothetical protein
LDVGRGLARVRHLKTSFGYAAAAAENITVTYPLGNVTT